MRRADDSGEIGISSLVLFLTTITIGGFVSVTMLDATDTVFTAADGTLDEVLSGMFPAMKVVTGYAVCNNSTVEALILKMTVGLAAGPVNLSGLFIETFDGETDCNQSDGDYSLAFIRNVGDANETVLDSGDLVSIRLDLVKTGQVLRPGETIEIVFYPVDSPLFAFSYTVPDILATTLVPLSA